MESGYCLIVPLFFIPTDIRRILIAERDAAMGAIVKAELSERLRVQIEVVEPGAFAGAASVPGTLVVALPT